MIQRCDRRGDCGLGVAPSLVGSVEFAAEQFGTPLVVVLGHSQCGAVSTTLQEITRDSSHRSPNLRAIVERVHAVNDWISDAPTTTTITTNISFQYIEGEAMLYHLSDLGVAAS